MGQRSIAASVGTFVVLLLIACGSREVDLTSESVSAYGTNGCADGTREGFTNIATYPGIAGCAGAFTIPGVNSTTVNPACARGAGNSSVNPTGTGCNIADLCGAGWHVCANSTEVVKYAAACDPTIPNTLFFITRQSSTGCNACATGVTAGGTCNSGSSCAAGCLRTDVTANDVYGCGHGIAAQGGACGILGASNNLCASLGANWSCGVDGIAEATNVKVLDGAGGGALCCIDSCVADAGCPGSQYCDSVTSTCAPKIANGIAVPNDPGLHSAGVCTVGVGTAVCTSGVCDTADNKCGYANGDGSCNGGNAATVCRSGTCSVSGVCMAAGACLLDGDCNTATQYCQISTKTCTAKVTNGNVLPTDASHVSPVLNGTCTVAAATTACVSGVCDTADNKCGYANGDGSCNGGNAATVCRSSTCSVSDGKCGNLNGSNCSGAGECRSGACTSGKCGTCATDSDCGSVSSGKVCDATNNCANGCRGSGGNGCAGGQVCSSSTAAIGTCSTPAVDAGVDAGADGGTPDAALADASTSADASVNADASASGDGATNSDGSIGMDGAAGADGSNVGPRQASGNGAGSLEGGGFDCSAARRAPRTSVGTLSFAVLLGALAGLRRRRTSPQSRLRSAGEPRSDC